MSYFNSSLTPLRFKVRAMKLEWGLVLKILAIGFAPFSMNMAMNVMNLILNRQLLHYGGDMAVAVMGIVYSVIIMVMMPLQGINQGAQPIIGYNYGARKIDRVRTAYWLAVKFATIFVTTGWLLIELLPGVFVRLFNSENHELILLGSRALRICSAMMPIIGFQVITSNYFQAVGKPLQSTFLSLSRQFLILIPLLYIMPTFWGVLGVYSALPLSDIISFCIAAIVMSFELRALREME